MSNGQLVKASIKPVNPAGEAIEFMFNPKEYTLSKTANWPEAGSSTSDAGQKNFTGGQGATLSLQLFFDTYLHRRGGSLDTVEDVRVHTDRLWQLLHIDQQTKDPKTDKSRPPEVLFQWGSTWHFKAVIKSMQQQFTLFMPNGMPVRAMVTLELQQSEDARLMPAGPSTYQISEQTRRVAGNANTDLRKRHTGSDR